MGQTSTAAAPPKPTPTSGLAPNIGKWRKEREKSARYWCGVIPYEEGNPTQPRPPAHTITVGGFAFQEWWTPWEGLGQDGSPRRGQYLGHVVDLTESQVAKIRAGCEQTIVRWRTREGRHAHGYPLPLPPDDAEIADLRKRLALNDREVARIKTRSELFIVRDEDEAVSRYVYCVKLPDDYVDGDKRRPSMTPPKSLFEVPLEAP